MQVFRYTVVAIVTGLVPFMGVSETKIQRSQLPAPVEATVKTQSQGAEVTGFTKEKEKGQLFYEVSLLSSGHTKDVQMDPQGNVTEIEEQVSLDTLPANVKAGLQSKAGAGHITKVESLTKQKRLVAYEAQVETGSRHSEVQVDANGKPLNHEE